MKTRVITGILIAVILLPVVYFGGWVMVILTTFLATVAVWELCNMHCQTRGLNRIYSYIIGSFAFIFSLMMGLVEMNVLNFSNQDLVFTLLVIISLLIIVPIFNSDILMKDIIAFLFFIIYGGVLITLVTSIRYVEYSYDLGYKYQPFGLLLILYLVATTMLTDVGAQIGGMLLGKRKLCPTISPKKTIEGSIIGSMTGAIMGTIVLIVGQTILKINLFKIESKVLEMVVIFLISLLLSIIGQLGDLVASKIKREYHIKDYGKIFPGHGGVMDRFDSILLSGTWFYLILMIMGVIKW